MPVVALGAADVLIIGIVAALLVFGLVLLFEFLSRTLSTVPTVGPWIGAHILPLAVSTRTRMMSLLSSALTPLNGWVLTQVSRGLDWVSQSVHLGNAITGTLGNIVTVQIPRVWSRAQAFTLSHVAAAVTQAQSAVSALSGQVAAQLSALQVRTRGWVDAAEARAARDTAALARQTFRDITAAETTAAAAAADAVTHADRLFTIAETQATRALQAAAATLAGEILIAKSDARSLFAAAEADLAKAVQDVEPYVLTVIDGQAAQAVTGVWSDLTDAAAGAVDAAQGGLSDVTDLLKSLPREVPASLAGVIAGLGVSTLAVTRYVEECGIPNCRNLSDLGRFFAGLLSAAEDAALLALLVEAVTDPAKAARTISDVVAPIVTDTATMFRSLIGAV